MTRTMYDSTSARDIPTTAAMVAGYLPPSPFAWSAADWGRFPGAVHVRIAVRAATNDGHVLDVETGDATPAQAPGWVQLRRAAGADPTVYCSQSAWASVRAAFAAANVAQPHYWIAAYPGGGPVIPAGAIAHQFADPATSGGHWDLSVVADYWPGVDQGADMPLTQADLDAIWNYPISNPNLPTAAPVVAKLLLTFGDEAAWAALAAAQGADADTKAGVAQLLVAVHSQPTGGQVDVQALATALVPLLSASEGAALVAALKAQFDK